MSVKIKKLTKKDKKMFEIFQQIDDRIYNGYMMGLYFGYPSCCIQYFLRYLNFNGSNTYQKYSKKCIRASQGTGFIPCPAHAKEINKGIVKIEDCINNRRCEKTNFPNGEFNELKFMTKYEEYKPIAFFYVFDVILQYPFDYTRYLKQESDENCWSEEEYTESSTE